MAGALSLPVGTRCEVFTKRTYVERCDNRCSGYTRLAANAQLNTFKNPTKVLVGENFKERLCLKQQSYQTAMNCSFPTLNGSIRKIADQEEQRDTEKTLVRGLLTTSDSEGCYGVTS